MNENVKKSIKRKLKGFTLVEVIVVMVILAILAALLLPSLTGYIDKANKQSAIVEARSVLTALQTTSSELYGRDKTFRAAKADAKATTLLGKKDEILTLAELPTEGTSLSDITCTAQAKITGFKWDNGSYEVTYTEANGFGDPQPK